MHEEGNGIHKAAAMAQHMHVLSTVMSAHPKTCALITRA